MLRFTKNLSKIVPKSNFLRNVGTLVLGTVSSQLCIILASPILTRLYSPDDFGLLSFFVSSLAIGLIVSALRFELAIPLPKSDEMAENILGLSLAVHLSSVMFLIFLTYFFKDTIAALLGLENSAWVLWFFPFGVLFVGGYNILIQWTVRKKEFGKIAVTRFFQVVVTLIIQFLGYTFGSVSLVVGHFIGQGVGITSLARPKMRKVTLYGMRESFKLYDRFPKYSLPAGLFRVAGTELPILFLALGFSSSSAGLYALTIKVLNAPASLIGTAIGQVFISDAPHAHRENKLDSLVKDLCTKLINIGSPFPLILILLGPELFSLTFGEKWSEAGAYAQWLSFWIYLVFISSPLTSLTTVLQKQKQGLYFHAGMFLLGLVALYFGLIEESVLMAVVYISFVNTFGRFFFVCWLYKISGNSVFEFLLENIKSFFFNGLCLLPALIAVFFYPSLWVVALTISLFFIVARCIRFLK